MSVHKRNQLTEVLCELDARITTKKKLLFDLPRLKEWDLNIVRNELHHLQQIHNSTER